MKKQTSLITLSLMLATPALAGGAGAPPPRAAAPATCRSIAQIIMNDPQFSTLLTAVQAAGLADTLKSGQYTLFAPSNAAFAKLPSDQLATVLNDPEMLRAVLLYHVAPGKVSSKQLMGLKSLKTAQGSTLSVSKMGTMAMVGRAHVTRADIPACNGVIHVIDAVLMPAMTAAAPMPAAPMPAAPAPAPVTTAPATPAAPAAAFDVRNIPATPLSGGTTGTGTTGMATGTTSTTTATTGTTMTGTTTTGTATTGTTAETTTSGTAATGTTETGTATGTTTTETTTTEAPATTETTTTEAPATTETAAAETTAEANTLYDVIVADDRFSTFRDLLSDAGMTEMLTNGDYTVFAPTNEAFDALPEGTLATLEANPDLLRQVLSYHIVQGRVTADQLASGTPLNAMAGGTLPTSMNGQMQMIGTAGVTDTVNTASNGTIYVINQVLLPPGLTLPSATNTSTTETTQAAATTTGTAATTTTTATGTATSAAPATATGTAATSTTTAPPVTGSASTSGTTPGNNTTLASLIASDPRFSTLAQLVQQAGLADTLASGEYTLFAPTNEAFNKLAPADLSALSADPARLKQVLLYHVVQGRVTGTALASSPQLTSVQGGALTLSRGGTPQRTMIGNAIIDPGASIDTGNGTLYVIDTVLMPPNR